VDTEINGRPVLDSHGRRPGRRGDRDPADAEDERAAVAEALPLDPVHAQRLRYRSRSRERRDESHDGEARHPGIVD
jgi:hypothetical protein